jgi:transcription elongation factor GreB
MTNSSAPGIMKEKLFNEGTAIYISILFGVFVILPFAIYRFFQKEWLIAFVDSIFAIGVISIAIYVWKTKDYRYAKLVGIIFSMICIAGIVYLRGVTEIYWVYPMMMASYYVVKLKEALILNIVCLAILSPILVNQSQTELLVDIVGAIFVTNLFGLVFAARDENHRKQLQEMALKDVMTNTGNRRALTDELERIHVLNKRTNMDVVMIMFDIDRFKDVNDTMGHHTGDVVLKEISDIIRKRIRSSDNFYRYGGEEFVILALDTDLKTATHLAESLREIVAKSVLSKDLKLTISLGVAELMGRWREPPPKSSAYITPAGYSNMEKELLSLWDKRKDVTKAITAAAAEGDRSENAEYIYRKKELRGIDKRIGYLQRRMPKLNIVKETGSTGNVFFGAWVVMEDAEGKEVTYRIVGPDEIHEKDEYISVDSIVARALLGKQVDDEIIIDIVNKKQQFFINRISYTKDS